MGKETGQAYMQWNESSMNMEKFDTEYEFKFIELLEIHQYVKAIDVHKASGVDGISSKILKDCFTICDAKYNSFLLSANGFFFSIY